MGPVVNPSLNLVMVVAKMTLALVSSATLWAMGIFPSLALILPAEPEAPPFPGPIAQQRLPGPDPFRWPDDDLPEPLGEEGPFLAPDPADPSHLRDSRDLEDPTPITINRIELRGNTRFSTDDLEPILSTASGSTTVGALNRVVAAITAEYINAGYITSRAILPSQPLDQGDITILVIEGSLAEVDITGLERLHPDYVRRRIDLGITTPFNANVLEDQLRLLNNDRNLASLQADLQSGETLGTSRLVLDVQEKRPWLGSVFTDNDSPASVGSERIGGSVGYRNLTGWGDEFRVGYTRTYAGGAQTWDLGYRIPVNPMEGTLDLRLEFGRSRIIQPPFDVLNIRGESQRYDLSFRQPLIRNPREELALALTFSRQTGQSFIFNDIGAPFGVGAEADGSTRTSVLRFSQDYLRRDVSGAWSGRSQFSLGIDVLGITRNADPVPDGRFFSWLGQVVRVQQLSPDSQMIVQGDFQLSPSHLLGSETFGIGGGQTLRGYRQNARSGDNGWRLSAENRTTVARINEGDHLFQVAPFFDMGFVWNNSNNPSQPPSDSFLAGVGLGLLWVSQPSLVARMDFALPLVNLSDRGNNLQDNGIYFSLSYQF